MAGRWKWAAINIVIRNSMSGWRRWKTSCWNMPCGGGGAVTMLQPSRLGRSPDLSTLKNLASALQEAGKDLTEKLKATAEAPRHQRIASPGFHSPPAGRKSAGVDEARPSVKRDQFPWASNFAAGRKEAKAKGKLIMVDFYTQNCGWCKRYDSEVFPKPAVSAAISQFVPVKVDADDGEGRPLVEQYQGAHPGEPSGDPVPRPRNRRSEVIYRIVGKIPGFMRPMSFVEQLNTIARLPNDIGKLQQHHAAHPDDMDELRQLVTALAMQGRRKEAAELASKAMDASSDPNFDRWASVYNTLGDDVMLRQGRMRPPDGQRRPVSRNDRSISITPGWAPASSRC